MIRVGFVVKPSRAAWMGGVNYFANLFSAVNSGAPFIEPVVFTGYSLSPAIAARFSKVKIIYAKEFDRFSVAWLKRQVLRRLLGYDYSLEKLFEKNGIAVLSHSGYLGPRSKIKTLGWIPDFQHKFLTTFFSAAEVKSRDAEFRALCQRCHRVLLSSHDSLKSMGMFYPWATARARVLQFVAEPAEIGQLKKLPELEQIYGFKGPYFHLPNQFWKHKNHQVLLKALALLKAEGHSVTVVSTGDTQDYRHPSYFGELMSEATSLGVSENFRVLGLVPFPDMVSLMANSIAVINPSLYEGWSTTVEEAKSLGKLVLLSNLGVHVEQAPPGGLFFDPSDACSLAALMLKARENRDPSADSLRQREAAVSFAQRQRRFGERYGEIIRELLPE